LVAAQAEAERIKRTAAAPAPAAPLALDDTPQQVRIAAATRQLEAALALEPDESKPAAAKPASLASALDQAATDMAAANGALASPTTAQTATAQRSPSAPATLSSLKVVADRPEAPSTALPERDLSLPTIVLRPASNATTGSAPTSLETTKLRRETIDGHVAPPPQPSRLMPFLAGAGVAGIALAAFIGVTAMRPGSGVLVANQGVTIEAAKRGVLAEAFSVGTQSPRGEIATDVDLPTALRLADYNLHGVDRPIDRAEAEFWLKKAMSLTASHSQIRWAMTQLGTLSAEPVTGAPDYEKARLLWEISAANGDPIAMCFLGTLMENGLGLAADRSKALEQFKRARGAGGCPNSDESIARLSK